MTCIDKSLLREPYSRLNDFLHTCIPESILIDRLEPCSAQVDPGSHHVYGPVLLRMVHDLPSKLRELVTVGSSLNIIGLGRELGDQEFKEVMDVLSLDLAVGRFALPCYELDKIMYELGIGRGERDVLLGEILDELLVGLEPDPVLG